MRKTLFPTAVRAVSSVLILSALALPCAHAAGLGKLTVLSSLGQPLRAEIELTAVSKDDSAIAAKLASLEAFHKANVEFNPALRSLHFSVEKRGARQVIRITSGQAMNEPYVDLLLELKSSSGHLVREYTFLLDPAELRTATAQVVAPVSVPALSSSTQTTPLPPVKQAAASEKPVKAAQRPVAAKQAKPEKTKEPAAKSDKGGTEHRVKKGDTLAVIAKQNKPEDVSLEQMLVATYRANPEAFIGNNMNRLKVGKVLSIPDAETAAGVSKSEAKKVIVAQTSDFTSYRNRLAGAAAQAAPQKAAEAGQVGGGQIGAKVEERPTAAAAAQDKLKVSKAEADKGDKSSGKGSAEDKLAKDKTAAEAQARIKELEKNIGDLQAVMQLKNKDLAAQQNQADKSAAPAASVPPASAAASASVPAPAVAASQPSVPPKRGVVAPPPPPPEPGFFDFLDDVLENPMMLGGICIVVLLLAYMLVRRRKKPAPSTAADIADEAPEPSNSMFGTSGGQSVDTNNSIFNSSFTPSASLLDTNEVDPVAEADVYIAYGREAQAIEILKEALRNHPERNALRVKLLEIYASQKDVHAFDLLASELFSLTKGEGEDWVYVAGLGVAIDPGNPLYAGGELSEELLAQPASLQTSVTRPAAELDPDFRLGAPRAEQVAPQDAALQITPEQLAAPDLPLDLAPAAEAAASDALDFDLGGKTVETAPPVEAPKPMADAGLDFAMPEPAATSAASLRPTEQAPESVPSLGFDLGDLNVEPADQGATPAVEVKELGNEALEYLADFKPSPVAGTQSPLDIAAASMPAAKDSPAEASATAGTEAVDFSDAPSAGGTDAVQAAPVTSSFDFGSINLDLAPHQPQEQDMTPSVKPDIAPPNESVPQAVVAPAAGSNDAEMNTKIDLADAYLGIGDKEGARELLEEVIQEGSGELVERAKAALAKIS